MSQAGNHLNSTYAILNIIDSCALDPFERLCKIIIDREPSEDEKYDYKPTIEGATFKILELQVYYNKRIKIVREKKLPVLGLENIQEEDI